MHDVITARISNAFPGAEVYIKNPLQDGQHFYALVVSDLFDGMSLVQRHRSVLLTLEHELAGPLHALSLKAYTTAEFEEKRESLTKYLS